jgi:hypothetical protein
MSVELGLIEGFFGRPWSWAERTEAVRFLGSRGYGFYLYAPKGDAWLRRRWREPHPDTEKAELLAFAAECRAADVRFGVGLSPFELHFGFDTAAKVALSAKLAALDDAGVQDLAILFDDMKGDLPDLAARQVEIVHWIAPRTKASRLIVCPSYYSDDPVLDRVFGQRPAGYLAELGRRLDPAVHVMWTGEEVCSREYSPGHLARVAQELRRQPFLWDNYPVNDGPRMSQHLHLRAFTGRPAAIGQHLAAHAVNPASQAVLSRTPALTLVESYARGEDYAYGAAFRRAAHEVLGAALAQRLEADLLLLEDVGLDKLGERRERLRERYAAFDHQGAREIVAWLDDAYAVTGEVIQTQ